MKKACRYLLKSRYPKWNHTWHAKCRFYHIKYNRVTLYFLIGGWSGPTCTLLMMHIPLKSEKNASRTKMRPIWLSQLLYRWRLSDNIDFSLWEMGNTTTRNTYLTFVISYRTTYFCIFRTLWWIIVKTKQNHSWHVIG